MDSRRRPLLAVAVAVLLVPASLAAQTAGTATGSIAGRVTDPTGAVLAGVKVAAAGSSLMGTRTTVTSAQGRYLLAALPPGEYQLSFALHGFTSSDPGPVRLHVGVTATLDIVMTVASIAERITVPARRSVLDRQTTAVAYAFDAREIASLPMGRDMTALVAATPGVDSTVDWLAYGTRGANRPMVEGILVTGIRSTPFRLDDGSFQEVTAATTGHGPLYATPGVHLQFVSKSGGIVYRGTLYAEHQDSRWQASNVDADQIRRGVQARGQERWHQHDLNADIGGFIVRDRLWWYASFRDQESTERLVSFRSGPHRTRLANYTGHATYRVSPANSLKAYGQMGRSHQPNRLDAFTVARSIHESDASTGNERGLGSLWKVEWNRTVGDSLHLEVRGGQYASATELSPTGIAPRYEDATTFEVRGGSRDWTRESVRNQLYGTASGFHDGRTGIHQVKAGFEVLRWVDGEIWRAGYPGNVLHVLSSGTAKEVYLFDTPSHSESGLWTFAIHAADTWQVNDRLTVNAGIRFDRNRVFLPAQSHPAGRPGAVRFAAVPNLISWNAVVPRLGAVYRITRGGEMLLKAGYGRYSLPPGMQLGSNSNPNSLVRFSRFAWSDVSGDLTWQPGEETTFLSSRGGRAAETLDPSTKPPLVDEFSLAVERQVGANVALRSAVVWRGERRHFARHNADWPFEAFSIPTVAQDPGEDGRLGTADDGPALSALTLPGELAKLRSVNVVRNVPGSSSEYWTWEAGVSRRWRGRWSLNAAFTHTWHRDQASGYAGQSVRNNRFPLTPNDLINTYGFGRHAFTTWTAKAHATYRAPHDVSITPVLQHYSGQPFGRVFDTNLGYGSVIVLAEPIGTRRMDHITSADVRVEKGMRLPGNRRVAGFVDVLNLFNSNAETSISWMSGDRFLEPLSIVSPRSVKVGLKLDW